MQDLKLLKRLNILFIEDEDNLRESLSKSFELIFAKVFTASNAKSGLKNYREKIVNIIIVDVNLGDMDGFEFVKEIRKDNLNIPIVFLTSHSEREYLLKALELQVDGYIVKPLDLDKFIEVMQRCVKKVEINSKVFITKEIYFDTNSKEVFKNNQKLKLGKKENLLLNLLIENIDNSISKEKIADNVWVNEYMSESALKNLILSLRKKIGKDLIVNITGIGWKLERRV